MTGADCNVECGDNSASEDEESREPLNQVEETIKVTSTQKQCKFVLCHTPEICRRLIKTVR